MHRDTAGVDLLSPRWSNAVSRDVCSDNEASSARPLDGSSKLLDEQFSIETLKAVIPLRCNGCVAGSLSDE